MVEFQYDDGQSFESNFERWFLLNSDERNDYNLRPYEREEAWMVFRNYVKGEWQDDQKKRSRS